jgi:hypothetical protein
MEGIASYSMRVDGQVNKVPLVLPGSKPAAKNIAGYIGSGRGEESIPDG